MTAEQLKNKTPAIPPVLILQAGQTSLHDAERLLILATLKRARFNRTRAAEMLGIGIRTLQRKIKQYSEEQDSTIGQDMQKTQIQFELRHPSGMALAL